jgi:predicted RNase H-like HicB family nuclease
MLKKTDKILEYDVVFEEASEGGYSVFVPSLPGCISEGDTFEEAKQNISDAISLYLESLTENEEEIVSEKRNLFIGKIQIPFPKISC